MMLNIDGKQSPGLHRGVRGAARPLHTRPARRTARAGTVVALTLDRQSLRGAPSTDTACGSGGREGVPGCPSVLDPTWEQ